MAFIPHPGPFGQTYRPHSTWPTWWVQALSKSVITLVLLALVSYACINHWTGENLVLVGHCHFAPTIPPGVHDPVLLCTQSPPDCDALELAIQKGSAIGVSDGLYMPQCYPALATAAWFLSDSPLPVLGSLHGTRTPIVHQCIPSRTSRAICPPSSPGIPLHQAQNHLRRGAHWIRQPRRFETSTTIPQTGTLCSSPC